MYELLTPQSLLLTFHFLRNRQNCPKPYEGSSLFPATTQQLDNPNKLDDPIT